MNLIVLHILLSILFTLICGPLFHSSQGHKYYLVLLDDFTYFAWIIPLKFKSEVYQKYIFVNMSKLNLSAPLKLSNVVMVRNWMIALLYCFVFNMEYFFVSHVLIPPHKMEKLNA